MSNDNYPAGVTDAHPHSNPNETTERLECGADEVMVVPSFAVKGELGRLEQTIRGMLVGTMRDLERLPRVLERITALREQVEELEKEGGYECPFNDYVDTVVSEEAHWDCPVCGTERVSDTIPEDRDPDEGWDNRHDD